MAIRLVAGLGNPGREHERDRHNVGFWFVERLASRLGVMLAKDAKFHACVARVSRPEGELWLMQPQTYMNLSGKAVGALARFYKIRPEEILIVHDELDFPPGTVKLKKGGGAGGHNGLRDIEAQLGSRDTWRLRFGIGHPGDKNVVADYVLKAPSPADREAIEGALDRALAVSDLMLAGDMEAAMLKLHTKVQP
ncbi:MAG: aminoacyl-tRNA hydrolase [Burkholderiales bacterium]|nr:aminoacyl-tRNA hydrolase [Burkholderiales bacterium]PZN00062.1 MAG: aminoacyl-tRNA hydrolase [Pseudomonadota bacterium]